MGNACTGSGASEWKNELLANQETHDVGEDFDESTRVARMSASSRSGRLFRTALYAPVMIAGMLLLAACATMAPVQEMSDARQALRYAEEAGAPELAPDTYLEAKASLIQAESSLQEGDYRTARRLADDARRRAISARIQAESSTD